MQLVTGYTGTKHVSAQDDSIRNVMLGEFNGRGVFPVFNKFEATAVTANEVRVSSGYGINQGRLFKIDRNDYDSCTIENGAAGYKRVDLIVARYLKNEQTGIESCELAVIKGTPNASSYVDPSYTKGNLLTGALQDDMPMYRVKINGVAIEAVEPMFETYRSLIGGAEKVIDQMVDDNFDDKMGANQQRFDNMISADHNSYTSQKNSDHQAYQTMMTENDDAFDAWFSSVQAYLDGDIAMKLTNAVASHNTALGAFTGNTKDDSDNVRELGVLPVSHGGTGASTVAGARNNLGLGNTTGALPVANGGTGQTSLQATRNAMGLGNTLGALPVANGGTGQTSLQATRNAMGLGNTTGALPIANGGTGVATSSALQQLIGNLMYPVGSIYMSTSSANPSSKFGGTWVAWGSGRVPVGVNASETEFNTVEKTGGAKSHSYTPAGSNSGGAVGSHTLTINEIPAHNHGSKTLTGEMRFRRYGTDSTGSNIVLSGSGVFSTEGTEEWSGSHAIINTDGKSYNKPIRDFIGIDATHTHTTQGGNAGHTHGLTQPTFTGTASTQSHLQPYITCYMWKRTA